MTQTLTLPVVPLRNAVLFPGVSQPIGAGRAGTLRAIEAGANSADHLVFAVTQRHEGEEITAEGLFTIGTVASIGQLQRGIGGMRLLLQGRFRGIAVRIAERDGHLEATVQPAQEMPPLDPQNTAF